MDRPISLCLVVGILLSSGVTGGGETPTFIKPHVRLGMSSRYYYPSGSPSPNGITRITFDPQDVLQCRIFGEGSLEAAQWVKKRKTWLWKGQVEKLLGDLEKQVASYGGDRRKALTELVRYLRTHKEQMR